MQLLRPSELKYPSASDKHSADALSERQNYGRIIPHCTVSERTRVGVVLLCFSRSSSRPDHYSSELTALHLLCEILRRDRSSARRRNSSASICAAGTISRMAAASSMQSLVLDICLFLLVLIRLSWIGRIVHPTTRIQVSVT